MSVFHSAANALVQQEIAGIDPPSISAGGPHLERTIAKDDWIRAVVKGADDRSPRWRHLLVLGGLLLGFGPIEDEALSRSMRSTLEGVLIAAADLALEEVHQTANELGQHSIVLVLNHCFATLSDGERKRLDYDSLLPLLLTSVLQSSEGLGSAYFLGTVDVDVHQVSAQKFNWPAMSASYNQTQAILQSPLVSSLGPLARLIGHTIEHVTDPWLVTSAVNDLETFARTLHMQWRHNKLSEIDASEEHLYLENETLTTTLPALWKLLRSTLFATVIIMRSVVGRMLGDGALAANNSE